MLDSSILLSSLESWLIDEMTKATHLGYSLTQRRRSCYSPSKTRIGKRSTAVGFAIALPATKRLMSKVSWPPSLNERNANAMIIDNPSVLVVLTSLEAAQRTCARPMTLEDTFLCSLPDEETLPSTDHSPALTYSPEPSNRQHRHPPQTQPSRQPKRTA